MKALVVLILGLSTLVLASPPVMGMSVTRVALPAAEQSQIQAIPVKIFETPEIGKDRPIERVVLDHTQCERKKRRPARNVGAVRVTRQNGDSNGGSAYLAGRDLVCTADHVLIDIIQKKQSPFETIEVMFEVWTGQECNFDKVIVEVDLNSIVNHSTSVDRVSLYGKENLITDGADSGCMRLKNPIGEKLGWLITSDGKSELNKGSKGTMKPHDDDTFCKGTSNPMPLLNKVHARRVKHRTVDFYSRGEDQDGTPYIHRYWDHFFAERHRICNIGYTYPDGFSSAVKETGDQCWATGFSWYETARNVKTNPPKGISHNCPHCTKGGCSGGPLMYRNEAGEFVVFAVKQFSEKQSRCTLLDVEKNAFEYSPKERSVNVASPVVPRPENKKTFEENNQALFPDDE